MFSLPITNPNGRPMLPFDWLIHSGLILARCHKILESDGCNFLFYFRSKGVVRNQLLGEGGPLNFGRGLRFFGCPFGGGGQTFLGSRFGEGHNLWVPSIKALGDVLALVGLVL